MARIGGDGEFNGYRRWHEADSVPPCDVQIVTSDGQSIPAHSCVLASASAVLERMLERPGRAIQILGVPSDAVLAFVQFLYSSTREGEEEAMERHGVQLLALAHKYRVGWLKRASEAGVAARLTPERVADALKIAKLCDAPRLFHRCLRLAAKDFSAVQTSDGWRFVRRHDPALELEFLQLLQDAQQRKTKWKRDRAAQEVYQQLSEAMDCLQHIFTEGCGCAYVGPTAGGDHASRRSKGPPCTRFATCEGLRRLMRHFAPCAKKLAPGGCLHCKRMWQLLRLHAAVCDRSDQSCKVPLCNQLRARMQMEEKVDKTWRLLVKKVKIARVMSSLANTKMPDIVVKSRSKYRGRR
ncbi:BTB/POZ and TAZ domain-containing protein 2-like [Ananas comosus]|uniref:BTB/POZ and TAZ domain-containing protein 2-like n=1 Tax=Ananas comosus TaxID=4615 RepID=A0A6P5GTA9_ANACO|nr:BTB/POZ and TAZ domain-containing protein 2-like [Ananas comosus]